MHELAKIIDGFCVINYEKDPDRLDKVIRKWLEEKIELLFTNLTVENPWKSALETRQILGLTPDPIEELAERFKSVLAGMAINVEGDIRKMNHPTEMNIFDFLNNNRKLLATEAIKWMEEKK